MAGYEETRENVFYSNTMKNLDTRHIIFHILIALYMLWLVVYGILLYITLHNASGNGNPSLNRALMLWVFFNLLMGSILFIVIRLYRNKTVLNRLVLYSYCFMGAATVVILTVIKMYYK
ncbi:hypothetical protein CHU92_14510 [Flavobacterium cyanobacteriorum]|uniref:Uncharacterized protein n=1 Tax=Flavobacterium cyanobacteriorum TaxID=2022802 RepID=A0A255YSA1_9FLAO|nr:hypothetical protein [Flavobacterium cyanobacteriorum]OYQ32086.1 hypothetical protein CHU92_14510 [Flavobacterium cyanobacteriorum]